MGSCDCRRILEDHDTLRVALVRMYDTRGNESWGPRSQGMGSLEVVSLGQYKLLTHARTHTQPRDHLNG